jgi:putative acetyltransferase
VTARDARSELDPAAVRPDVTIRPEAAGDADAVRDLIDAAFAPSTEESRIADELRVSDAWLPELSLVATERDGTIVGQSVTSRAELVAADGSSRPILALGPIAVLPACQGRGIGGALLEQTFAASTDLGWPIIVLLGHPTYYPRFGFESARALGIEPQQPWPDPAWMARKLPGWTPELRGTLRYPPAFRIE